MRFTRRLSPALILCVLLAAVLPGAVLGDEGRKAEVMGVVISVNPADGSFQFREFGTEMIWAAILRRDVHFELKGGKGAKPSGVAVGDIVEVEGQVVTGRSVLAKKVKILAHSSAQPAPSLPSPAPGQAPPALSLAAIVKTLGVGVAVKAFAPAINTFINNLLQARDAKTQQTTKVVPILSISIGVNAPGSATIGAAQVSGSKAAVDRVQAVAAIDGNFQGTFSVRALVPVDSLEPWKRVRRVPGVGVSAIIDLKI